MTLPDTIRIGGVDYSVVTVQGLRDGKHELNGRIRYNQCLIEIEADMHPHKQFITLWHEILHGLIEHAGIEQPEEGIILSLGYGITQVLRDNEYLRGN